VLLAVVQRSLLVILVQLRPVALKWHHADPVVVQLQHAALKSLLAIHVQLHPAIADVV